MNHQRGFGVVGVVLIAALLVVGIGGWRYYQKRLAQEEVAFVSAQILDATDRVRRQIDFFKAPRGETYAEAIAAAEESAKAIDVSIASLRKVDRALNPPLITHAVEYLQASQASVRSFRNLVRAKAEFTVAVNAVKSAQADLEAFIANPRDEATKFHSDVASYAAGPIQKRLAAADNDLDAAVRATSAALSQQVAVAARRPSAIPPVNYLGAEEGNGITIKVL